MIHKLMTKSISDFQWSNRKPYSARFSLRIKETKITMSMNPAATIPPAFALITGETGFKNVMKIVNAMAVA